MDVCPPGFMPISDAYETIVQTLEPDARPGDDYLDKLLKDKGTTPLPLPLTRRLRSKKGRRGCSPMRSRTSSWRAGYV